IALNKKQSKALAITAIALGGIAFLCSSAVTVAAWNAPASLTTQERVPAEVEDEPVGSSPDASEDPADASETEDSADAGETEDTDSAASPDTGTPENPLPQPYVAKGLFDGEK